MVIDENALRHNANNLTLARLILAASVMYSHCWWEITGSDEDALSSLIGSPIATFAVDGFFFISGFLVYRSLVLRADIKLFAMSRFARLWPGLATMALIVVVAGFFSTTEPSIAYFSSSLKTFLIGNLSMTTLVASLPGISCSGVPCNINGSLWSIPWEVRCYLILGFLYVTGLSSRKPMIIFVLPLTIAFACIYDIPSVQKMVHFSIPSGPAFYLDRLDRLWTAFALGIFSYIFVNYIPVRWFFLVILVALTIVVHAYVPVADTHVRTVLAGYGVLVLGFSTVRCLGAFSAKWPDYSYGLYIYAFPVMFWVHRNGVNDFHTLLLITMTLTTALAALSWHLVESPAMRLLKKTTDARMPTSRSLASIKLDEATQRVQLR